MAVRKELHDRVKAKAVKKRITIITAADEAFTPWLNQK